MDAGPADAADKKEGATIVYVTRYSSLSALVASVVTPPLLHGLGDKPAAATHDAGFLAQHED